MGNIFEALIELTDKYLRKPDTVVVESGTDKNAEVLIVPNGMTVHPVKQYLDAYRDKPERKQGTAHLGDQASFVAHANRFKSEHSAVFAQRSPPSLTSVLDYHQAGKGDPAFGKHRGVYSFPLSDQWNAWKQAEGNKFGQREFALFIENNLFDVAEPASAFDPAKDFAARLGCQFATGAKLLELSRGLAVNVEQQVASAVNLGSGEGQIVFKETHADSTGAPIRVPGAFLIAIPVFKSGALYQIPVRLRYRAHQGQITWSLELFGIDRIFDHAFNEVCEYAAKETLLPLFVGSPE